MRLEGPGLGVEPGCRFVFHPDTCVNSHAPSRCDLVSSYYKIFIIEWIGVGNDAPSAIPTKRSFSP